ncbi:MAG: 23S rRNA (pseudouridine(1915)-N(3))-methyltransferase RlmH [Firmicutes bacterium]|nr:23S rRNA (pseudouridine(1915)-N(3))-methyltransferase RlmH [Candidatus Fiminaster equi]
MNIKIYCIGKIKEQYLKDGIAEYLKRLSPYAKTEIIEVMDSKIKDNPNDFDITKAKNEEGDRVLKLIKNDYLIGLDLNKKEFTSEEFANFIEEKLVEGGSSISFVIGGSYGLSENLKKRCNSSISLSKLTYLHQMTRLILLEQIYRSFKILNNETYHK